MAEWGGVGEGGGRREEEWDCPQRSVVAVVDGVRVWEDWALVISLLPSFEKTLVRQT